MEEIILQLIYWLKDLSYLGIVLMLTIELVPGEIVLPLAGYWVYQGDFHFALTVLAGTIGGVTGPLTFYLLGRYGGRPFIVKYGKYFLIKEKQLVQAETFFEKYGSGVVFFGRFIPVIRTVISAPAGITKMSVIKFITYTALGVFPITFFYVYIGMKLGVHWERANEVIEPYLRGIALGVVAIVLLVAIVRWLKRMNKETANQ